MNTGFLEVTIKQRQLELWASVVREFAIPSSINTQVQSWIRAGCIEEKAYAAAQKRRSAKS